MNFFPTITLRNKYYLGDNVLLEPVARILAESFGAPVYVSSRYPEVFIGHPTVRGILPEGKLPVGTRVIDMGDAIRSLEDRDGVSVVIEEKLRRMYEAAGLSENQIISPRLYLTPEEIEQAQDLDKRLPGNRIGIALESRHEFKNMPYTNYLVKRLTRSGYSVFAFGKDLSGNYDWMDNAPIIKIVDMPLREAMVYISLMDQFLGPDTALLHIAGAFDIPFVVVTREIWRDLYECYDVGKILAAKHFGKKSMSTLPVSPWRILRAVKSQRSVPKPREAHSRIGLFRLDGLGGTLTLADQAKKIYEKTGIRSDLIVRGYAEAFRDNPYVNKVVETGRMVDWDVSLAEHLEKYDILAEIRFAPGKWHQKGEKLFHQDFRAIKELFDAFPMRLNEWESEGLHQVQLTDRTLGLPYEEIDMEIFNYGDRPEDLPEEYVAACNGVDVQHTGMFQTKCWPYWDQLPRLLDIPVVQVGTYHDEVINGAIDLRGKTTVPQFFTVLRDAAGVVCTEGGTMHSAYAVGNEKAVIIRGPVSGKLFHYPGQQVVDSYICKGCVGSTGDWYIHCPEEINAACMKTISAERVAMNLEEVLNGN